MGESGGDGREKRDEISLLTEELIQLSVKGSMVVPSVKPTLICTIWTEKLYNPESFKAQMRSIWKTNKKFEIQTVGQNLYLIAFELEEDLKLIMEGRPYGRVGHGLSNCSEWNPAEKIKIKEDPPYTLALKAESNVIGKESIKFNNFSKKTRAQSSYTGSSEMEAMNGIIQGGLQSSGEEKLMEEQKEVSTDMKDEQMDEIKNRQVINLNLAKKTSWRRDISNQSRAQRKDESSTRKRKANEDEVEIGDGVCWKVGKGTEISAMNDGWIPDFNYARLSSHFNNLCDFRVANLIDDNNRKWKRELVVSTFPEEIAEKILRIPLTKQPHDDYLAWREESSGEYHGIRSAFKLLQSIESDPRGYALQNECRKFYNELWLLNLPTKLKITVWRISWNYLPTWVNLHHRRLLNNISCSWCGRAAETTNHIFRECPGVISIWKELSFSEILQVPHTEFFQSGKEIAKFIKSYIFELNGIEEKTPKVLAGIRKWKYPPDQFVKINFDAAFDGNLNQSAARIVARDSEGNVLLSLTDVHNQVASAFAVEAIACRTATQIGIDNGQISSSKETHYRLLKKCKIKSQDRSMIGAYIYDIHQLLAKSNNISFEYIPREGNSLALSLAVETLKRKDEIYLIGRVPEYAENLKEKEKASELD
ncbi:hypothetical protein Gotur_033734 [Gossypium turneri]